MSRPSAGFLRLLLESDRNPEPLKIRPGLTLVCVRCKRADGVQQRWHRNRVLRALQWVEQFCPRCKCHWIAWHGLEQITGMAVRFHQTRYAHIDGLSYTQEVQMVRLAAQYRRTRGDISEVDPALEEERNEEMNANQPEEEST